MMLTGLGGQMYQSTFSMAAKNTFNMGPKELGYLQVLQCVAACCGVVHCFGMCYWCISPLFPWHQKLYLKWIARSSAISRCCSVLQCGAECVAVWCRVCCSVLHTHFPWHPKISFKWVPKSLIIFSCCSVLQRLQCVAVCVAVYCNTMAAKK